MRNPYRGVSVFDCIAVVALHFPQHFIVKIVNSQAALQSDFNETFAFEITVDFRWNQKIQCRVIPCTFYPVSHYGDDLFQHQGLCIIRQPEHWSFSFIVSPSSEFPSQGCFSCAP